MYTALFAPASLESESMKVGGVETPQYNALRRQITRQVVLKKADLGPVSWCIEILSIDRGTQIQSR